MSIDPKAFRHTVGHFVTGVTVIAAEIDGSIRGMTANAFTSLSLDPPLVLFCVAKKAHLGQVHPAARAASRSTSSRRHSRRSRLTSPAAGKSPSRRRSHSSRGRAARSSPASPRRSAVPSRRFTKAATTSSSSDACWPSITARLQRRRLCSTQDAMRRSPNPWSAPTSARGSAWRRSRPAIWMPSIADEWDGRVYSGRK